MLKPFHLSVFEYDGFSGDGPINLFIEENLLQHRAPRPRKRAGTRLFQTKTTSPSSSKKTSHSAKLTGNEPTSKSHIEFISATGTTSLDASTRSQGDTSTMRSITFRPATTAQKDTHTQTTQSVTAGITKWPIPLLAEPAAPSSTVTPEETTKTTTITTAQPFENTASNKIVPTFTHTPASVMETSSLVLKHHMQPPGSTVDKPITPVTEAATVSQTPSMALTTLAAQTSAPVHPTTPAAAVKAPQQDTGSTYFSDPVLPPSTILPVTTSVSISSTTSTSTSQAAQVKPKYKISWEEEEGKDELDEPMQQQEGSTSRKPGK